MKTYLLGFASALGFLALALVIVVLTLGHAGSPGAPAPTPPTGAAAPTAPTDLKKGETWLGQVDLSSNSVVTRDGSLRDVRAVGSNVRLGNSGLVAGRLSLDAIVPFEVAAAQIGGGAKLFPAANGRAGITRTVTLLGRQITVSAVGTVTADRGQLLIKPEQVDLGGGSWLNSGLSALAREAVTIRQPIEGVPEGMRLTKVSVADTGFRAHLEGADITLAQ